jgi:hypothetical protein
VQLRDPLERERQPPDLVGSGAGVRPGAGRDGAEDEHHTGHRHQQAAEHEQLTAHRRRAGRPRRIGAVHKHQRRPDHQHREQEVRHDPRR